MPSVYREKECPSCKTSYRGRGKTCSLKCSNDLKRAEKVSLWLEGKHDGMRGSTQTASFIKQYLRDTRGDKCEKCGWNEVHPSTGNVPIELNHIDGDFTNNKIENLEIICPNCHSLTRSYRALNMGNGRPRK